jgi:hypothetical protein
VRSICVHPRFGVPLRSAVAAAIVIGTLVGCGEGERIAVVPELSTLDLAPDPFVVAVAPLCGDRIQMDAVWLDNDQAVIVGAAGLILGKSGDDPWLVEASGTDLTLLAAAALGDGRVVTVGEDGIILERADGIWTRRESGTTHTLREITVAADRAWAVGDKGVLVRRLSTGAWEPLDCPTDADLTGVCVQGDTLYVSGREPLLLRRVNELWTDLSDGPWGSRNVSAIAAMPAGPTAVLADSLYLLRDGGWASKDTYLHYEDYKGMKAAHGYFWLEGKSRIARVNVLDESWNYRYYRGSGYPLHIAPRDTARALVVSGEGGIRWYDSDYSYRYDSAGGPGTPLLFRLGDGSTGCLTRAGLFMPTATGLVPPAAFSEETRHIFRYADGVAGASFEDFYLINTRDLYRVLDGEATLETELPNGSSAIAMAIDELGTVFIGTQEGVYSWEGGVLTKVLSGREDERDFADLGVGPGGTVMAWGSGGSWYRDRNDWVCMTNKQVLYCGETEAGEILSVTRHGGYIFSGSASDSLHIWRRDAGTRVSREIHLVPGAESLPICGAVADDSGFYVATCEPSRIFRLDGDPRAGRWEAVAGPFAGRITKMMPMDDGSQLVFDSIRNHLLMRRSH